MEVTQAIDALGILRTIAPAKAFALATDGDLKLRALRNPWCRVKAMQLYGITLPGSDGAVPPDIGQLLHLKPGDNCPVCRQRAQMQAAPPETCNAACAIAIANAATSPRRHPERSLWRLCDKGGVKDR